MVEKPSTEERVRSALAQLLGTRRQYVAVHAATGIAEGTLKDWGRGVTTPKVDQFVRVAEAVGEDPWKLLGIEPPAAPAREAAAPVDGLVSVPMLDVAAACGPGRVIAEVTSAEAFWFADAWLRKLSANPRRVEGLRAAGDSMSPTIADGALLIIDRSQTEPPWQKRRGTGRDDDVFVFLLGDELRLKRLRRIDETHVAAISDQAAGYPVEIIALRGGPRLTVLGRVVWWDNRL